jgi:ERCC4-type nuclease
MKTLDIFSNEKIEKREKSKLNIIADYREKNSLVISELESLNVKVKIKHLKVGDYKIKNTIVERKTISDFVSSMINKRLLK